MDLDDALRLGRDLLRRHGLAHWQIGLDRARRRAGACRFGERRITLSAPLTELHAEAEVRETILHEIAHALAGPGHAHDAVWRAQARAIGATGERCVPTAAPSVPGAWRGTCSAGHVTERHRRPARVLTCSRCSPRFDLEAVFHWTRHGREAPMLPAYEAELAALEAGRPLRRLEPGSRVRLPAHPGMGRWAGRHGVVERVGRTRYRVKVSGAVITVPFPLLDGGVAGSS